MRAPATFAASLVLGASLAAAAGAQDAAPTAPAAIAECPFYASPLAEGTVLTCNCPANAVRSGAVWGNGPYTADSAICRAALHAGATRREGGQVTLRVLPGRERYQRGERNGVSTGSWPAFPKSFDFDR